MNISTVLSEFFRAMWATTIMLRLKEIRYWSIVVSDLLKTWVQKIQKSWTKMWQLAPVYPIFEDKFEVGARYTHCFTRMIFWGICCTGCFSRSRSFWMVAHKCILSCAARSRVVRRIGLSRAHARSIIDFGCMVIG